jgi:hypothetical protein
MSMIRGNLIIKMPWTKKEKEVEMKLLETTNLHNK